MRTRGSVVPTAPESRYTIVGDSKRLHRATRFMYLGYDASCSKVPKSMWMTNTNERPNSARLELDAGQAVNLRYLKVNPITAVYHVSSQNHSEIWRQRLQLSS